MENITYTLSLCQFSSSFDRAVSRAKAGDFVRRAAADGAAVVALPEMWNCPYENRYFREYAEPADGATVEFMARLAEECGVYLVGGSIPELVGDKLRNSSFIFAKDGSQLGSFSKMHMFDVDIEGGVTFKESATLEAGTSLTVVDTEFGKIGVAICYDARFPDMFRAMADAGAHLVVMPASFSPVTGAAHWDILMKSRAVDEQIYIAACSPAPDPDAPYQAFGHSCIVDPWGSFVTYAGTDETIASGVIDLGYLAKVRAQVPVTEQRRYDFYHIKER
ncbi:MAG: carbon-nitrogen hydrolase family protein [Clostridiales Family XIII bacterium]|jgi:predicted amidohydrolase|nr:carbon-nitrogen hydrolase family protein [Clostridiales Family XIII bacterium]